MKTKTRSLLSLALATTFLGSLAVNHGGRAQAAPEKIRLRVLYVGHPQTPREKDFVECLQKHFVKVGKGDLDKFGEKDAEGYDVVILDYSGLVIKDNAILFPAPPFGDSYSRPTVTVGATGALVCGGLRLKTGYL